MRLLRNKCDAGIATQWRGFTLIEVMVAMIIIAILAALTYPSYRHAVIKSRRAEAKAALLQLMQQQERYFSQSNSYIVFSAAATQGDAKRFKWFSGNTVEGSAYEIDGIACEGETIQNCVKLRAKPGTARVNVAFADPECGELNLTSTGVKSAEGNLPQCW
ncbi:MAG: type IV pilin protein [Burkholderiales bacterium]|nr:type IV pilin protein [Burkholderiales bacterium]